MKKEYIKERIKEINSRIKDILSFGILDNELNSLLKEKENIQKECPHQETKNIDGKIVCAICDKKIK